MILAIDPGNKESAYVLLRDDLSLLSFGKLKNEEILEVIQDKYYEHFAIEMIASYGMAVGAEVFETCVWIGRFYQMANLCNCQYIQKIYRKEEKMTLCGTMKAKDSNIVQALIDRFAPNTSNKGKGTKKNPGWFYGFKADVWQSYAVGVTYHDLYLKDTN